MGVGSGRVEVKGEAYLTGRHCIDLSADGRHGSPRSGPGDGAEVGYGT